MATELRLAVSLYRCEPCTMKQGTDVKELIRMAPRAILLNGELQLEEWWGCPICLEAKFPVKKPRSRKGERSKSVDGGSPARAAGASDRKRKGAAGR